MMCLGFLTPEYPHPKVRHAAGLGTSIGNLTKALAKEGHEVHVFVYGQDEGGNFTEDDIHFHLIADRSYAFGKWWRYRKHIQKQVQNCITEYGIDLLEVPDWTGISAFMRFSVPVVMRFHGSDTYFCHLENRPQKWKNRWFEQRAVNGAKAYIAPTAFAGQLSKTLFNIKDKHISTIHYGLTLERFCNPHPQDYETNTVLYIGTLIRKKGVFELPGILKQVQQQCPKVKLVLVGSDAPDVHTGSQSTWTLLEADFKAKGVEAVAYWGKLPYQDVHQVMANAHICVFPTFAETLGMVTIEAMALHKPVVNSNIGWAQELMQDGKSGFLVHPKDHQHYANRIVGLLKNPDLCSKLGSAARTFVEQRFDIAKQTDKNIGFYKSLISK